MKYIKINTPLAVKGGFVTNSALVVMDFSNKDYYVLNVYKDYDAFNKGELPLKLKNELPRMCEYNLRNGDINTNIINYLKANEYDVELADTDASVDFKEQLKQARTDEYIKAADMLLGVKETLFKEQLRQAQADAQELAVDKDYIKFKLNDLVESIGDIERKFRGFKVDYEYALTVNDMFTNARNSLTDVAIRLGYKIN